MGNQNVKIDKGVERNETELDHWRYDDEPSTKWMWGKRSRREKV